MEDDVGAAHRAGDLFIAADIGAMEVHGFAHFVQIAFVPGQQVIDDRDLLRPFAQQGSHNRRADKPGASGNNVFAHDGSFAISASRWRSDSLASFSAPGVKSNASSETQP